MEIVSGSHMIYRLAGALHSLPLPLPSAIGRSVRVIPEALRNVRCSSFSVKGNRGRE